MFRADAMHRVRMPSAVSALDAGSAYYELIEPIANLPTWLIHVLPSPVASDDMPRWRRLMTTSLPYALSVMASREWLRVRLYVLLPPSSPTEEGASTAQCLSVWECREPRGEEVCWLVDTDCGAVVDSAFGTRPAQAKRVRLVWSDDTAR